MKLFDSFFKKRNIILSKEMIDKKMILDNCKNNISDIERDLTNKKLEEKILKFDFQQLCNHEKMVYPKKKYESDNYSDYVAKCSVCQSEVFDKNRALSYLTALNELLSRYPKVLEMLKLSDNTNLYNSSKDSMNKIFDLMIDISKLRSIINDIDIDKYNENINDRCKNW